MDKSAPILHVEDDPVDVGNLQRAFLRCGIQNPLLAAANGVEALRLLRGDPAGPGTPPGLVLLDLSMPRMSGLEFLREVKSDPGLRGTPVVVLTASSQEADRWQAYTSGAAGYVVKPIEFDRFVEVVGVVQRYWTLCETPYRRDSRWPG